MLFCLLIFSCFSLNTRTSCSSQAGFICKLSCPWPLHHLSLAKSSNSSPALGITKVNCRTKSLNVFSAQEKMEGNLQAGKNICSREQTQGSSTVLSSLVVAFHAKQHAGVDKAESSSQHYHRSQNPGHLQTTRRFWFISIFLLDTEITFPVTYSDLEEITHRLKPSQIHRELINECSLSPAIANIHIKVFNFV